MNIKLFLSKYTNIKAENKLLKFFIILIGGLQLINLFWNTTLLKQEKIILIPPGLQEKATISSNTISENALRQYVRYIVSLALNYNASTARKQFEELLLLYPPHLITEKKNEYYNMASNIETAKITSSFFIEKITLEKNTIEVVGNKIEYLNELKAKEKSEIYIIEYTIENAQFKLQRIYKKNS